MADNQDVSVVFGANIQGLVNGVEEIKEHLETLGGATQGLISTFTEIGSVIAEAFAVEKVQEFVEHMAEMGTDMARMEEQLGMTSEQMNVLRFAAEGSDTQLQMLTRSITQFDRMAEEAKNGTGHAADAFKALGIDAQAYLAAGHSLNDLFTLTTQKLDGFASSQEKAAAVSMIFGGRSSQLIKVLDDLGGKYDEISDAVKRSGVVVEGFEEAAQGTKEQLVELAGAGRGLEETLFMKLKPAFDLIEGGLINFVEGVTKAISHSTSLDVVVKALTLTLKSFAVTAIAAANGIEMMYMTVQASIGALIEAQEHGFKAGKAVWDTQMAAIKKTNQDAWQEIADIWHKDPTTAETPESKKTMGHITDTAKELAEIKRLRDEDIAAHKSQLDLDLANDGENLRAKMAHAQAYYDWLKSKYGDDTRAVNEAAKKISEIQNQEIKKDEENWNKFFDTFNRGFMGMIGRTMTFKQAMQNAAQGILLDWIKSEEKQLAHHIATEQVKTAATNVGNAERTASDKAAAGASTSMFSIAGQKAIVGDAAKAYAGTYGFLAPVMGPFAAVPAAGSFAAVMAMEELLPSFDVGSWNVPGDMMANIHQGEMIVPAAQAEQIRSGSGGSGMNVTINAVDAQSFYNLVKNNPKAIMDVLQTQVRNGNPAAASFRG